MNGHETSHVPPPTRAQKRAALLLVLFFLAFVGIGGWYLRSHTGGASSSSGMLYGRGSGGSGLPAIQQEGLTVTFAGELRASSSKVRIEFRNANGQLVDAGKVRLGLDMDMPGMPMHEEADVAGSGGRYVATLRPQMAGDWRAKLDYQGPRGPVEKIFQVKVH